MYLFLPAAAAAAAETVSPTVGIAAGIASLMRWMGLEGNGRRDSRVGRVERRRSVQCTGEVERRISDNLTLTV